MQLSSNLIIKNTGFFFMWFECEKDTIIHLMGGGGGEEG